MSRPSRLLFINGSPAEIDLWDAALHARQWNAVIEEAMSGHRAMDLMQRRIHRDDAPDIVLLEYGMRGTSCLNILQSIRAMAYYANVPIYILSDLRIPEPIRREFQNYGVMTILAKPTDFAGFSKQIDILRTTLEDYGCISSSGSWVASQL
jgi:DNA-binding response OmpR family regulator